MANIYGGIDLIGGGIGAVDKINGSVLADKDVFLVTTISGFYPFHLDADSGAAEDSPEVIGPDTNPGNKRWVLTGGVFAGLTLYGNVIMPDGGTIRCAGAPVLTFDDDNDYLEITGCKVGINTATPAAVVEIVDDGKATNIIPVLSVRQDDEVPVGFVIGNNTLDPLAYRGLRLKVNAAGAAIIDTYIDGAYKDLLLNPDGGNVGVNDNAPGSKFDVNGDVNTTDVYKVDDVQVIRARVIDARCDDAINSGDATTDGVIDALRDAMITHGMIAAA